MKDLKHIKRFNESEENLNFHQENLNISDVISMLPTDKDVREFLKDGYMGFDENSIYLEQGFESGVEWVREILMKKLKGN